MNKPTKSVLITGGNVGLGYQAARQLLIDGWHVIVASRNKTRTATAIQQLQFATGSTAITAMQLDLASLDNVRQFARDFTALDVPPLHAIVCNAGVTMRKLTYSPDGYETTFAINHLGHFLLVNLLLEHVHATGRIVFVSSGTHIPEHRLARLTGTPVSKYVSARALALPQEATPKDRITGPSQAYTTSKLCNVLCTYELSRRLIAGGHSTPQSPINVYAIDPGLMPDTAFIRDYPAALRAIFRAAFLSITPLVTGVRRSARSGQDLARLVTDSTLMNTPTAYFDGHRQTRSSAESYDLDRASDLWQTSVELTDLTPDETILRLLVTATA